MRRKYIWKIYLIKRNQRLISIINDACINNTLSVLFTIIYEKFLQENLNILSLTHSRTKNAIPLDPVFCNIHQFEDIIH